MSAVIFGPELLIVVFVLGIPALALWAAIDAGTKPTWAFERTSQSKGLWIVLPLIGIFTCGVITVVAAIVWFASIRPKIMSAIVGGSSDGPPLPQANAAALPLFPPASWSADPLGRHELRYWNGTQWTEHVSDGGVTSSDPPQPTS